MKVFYALLLTLLIISTSIKAQENLFEPLPQGADKLTSKQQLGKELFHDPILSRDNTVSCATCHPLMNYGVDNQAKSFGINGQLGKRNTPTVWNSRYNVSQFWDGRAKNLKEQVHVPITNKFEMGETMPNVVKKLKSNPHYKQWFDELYSNGVTAENVADAIAAFEETLVTSNSRFDQYLRGNKSALSVKEQEGLRLFKSKGCVACHNGINVGGTLYQKIGFFEDFQDGNATDLGRYNVTKEEFDKYYFKVPSLRNVEKTAPYFHDGSVATLKEAVKIMGQLQLGRDLTDKEIDHITAFLKTLTGNVYE